MKKVILGMVTCVLLISTNAGAQTSSDENDKASFGVSLNPAYFILGGYSVRGIYHLPKKWSLGLSVEAGFELPDDFRDIFFNDNQAIDVHWDYLIGAEFRYRFNDNPFDEGFYAFGTLGIEGWTVTEINTGSEESFDNWYSGIGFGYNWYPFKKKNFNVGVNYNVIFILNNTDDQMTGDTVFSIDSFIPPSLVPSTLTIGWRFD
ncbi:MAG: outer membrane beta-barrel protein [Bacteroidota bacterium]